MKKNFGLSRAHYVVAIITVLDVIYMFYHYMAISSSSSTYLLGEVIGKMVVIGLHLYAAKRVLDGTKNSRYISLFLTVFLLFAFPIGTILAVIMLFLLYKWEKEPDFFSVTK
ncbi:hypothetical protein I5523_03910 [Acinetobacter oleivorans]|uniref:hypothetical protein n=1 Tax=Acinetobacter oleivorans TaxID=1148157 RepID=UPI00190158A6|nr:hypothetical protein [Acinetobacter oleivorans]MBJ9738787.1 hypothetical protein [Acinetobacter oleivorans]MCU4408937.1 hypothetical protein [Acinetobacter oleivorans]